MLSGEFNVEFQEKYQRNNKRTGQKNLRCFPTCSQPAHKPSGFCGTAVSCTVYNLKIPNNTIVRAWGEFVEEGTDDQLRKGEKVNIAKTVAQERSKGSPTLPLLVGEVSFEGAQDGCTQIVFNRQRLGWHYHWTSTKHTCDTYHSFRVRVYFQKYGSDSMVYVGALKSPLFQLFSRRRQGAVLQPAVSKKRKLDEAAEEALPPPISQNSTWRNSFSQFIHNLQPTAWGGTVPTEEPQQTTAEQYKRNRLLDRLIQFTTHYSSGASPKSAGEEVEPVSMSSGMFADGFAAFGKDSAICNSEFKEIEEIEVLLAEEKNAEKTEVDFSGLQVDCNKAINELAQVLKLYGSDTSDAHVNQVIDNINTLSEAVLSLGRNNEGFSSVYKRWSSPEALKVLKQQFRQESDPNFEWTAAREDETYNEKYPHLNTEISIFAEVRNCFRKLILNALTMSELDLKVFSEPMELAARHGVLSPDPYYPPKLREAAFIHMQIYGTTKNLEKQDYGARRKRFKNLEQQRAYAKDLLMLKRGVFRRLLCSRIAMEQRSEDMFSHGNPVPPAWDINGSWLNMDLKAVKDEKNLGIARALHIVMGLGFGSFFAKLFYTMLTKLDFKINEKTFLIQGEKVMFANPRITVPMDGRPAPFTPPIPLPMVPFVQEKQVVGFFSVEPDGRTHVVNWVVGGPALESQLKNVIDLRNKIQLYDEGGGPPSEGHAAILEFMQAKKDQKGEPEMRVHMKIAIDPDNRERMSLTQSVYFFAGGDAPSLTSKEELLTLSSKSHKGVLISRFCMRYMRSYLDPNDTDIILDLL